MAFISVLQRGQGALSLQNECVLDVQLDEVGRAVLLQSL